MTMAVEYLMEIVGHLCVRDHVNKEWAIRLNAIHLKSTFDFYLEKYHLIDRAKTGFLFVLGVIMGKVPQAQLRQAIN